MISLAQAPKAGRVLACAPDRLVFDGYELQGDAVMLRAGGQLDLEGVYELHLFDTETEFRATHYGDEWLERVICAQDEIEDEDHFVFTESQFIRERYWVEAQNEHLVVNNHFSFNEDGFLCLDDFRLAMEADA